MLRERPIPKLMTCWSERTLDNASIEHARHSLGRLGFRRVTMSIDCVLSALWDTKTVL
jgi:hypothetical protein